MTKSDYSELLDFMNNLEMASTGIGKINILRSGDIIHFKGDGKLSALDSVKINLGTNKVEIGRYTLPFKENIDNKNDSAGLKSKWKGYEWKFEQSNNQNINSAIDLFSLVNKEYELSVGRLDKSGKTILWIKCRELSNGTRSVDFELPLIF